MKINISLSPCPNDTFIFDALINSKIKHQKYDFSFHIADVEELNIMSKKLIPDVTKISFYSFFQVAKDYQLLTSGSAVGKNCGPLIISKRKIYPDEIPYSKIAVPGFNTTAFLLLKILFPDFAATENDNAKPYLFSDIEDVVLSDECDAGLIIHETRFTYKKKGLLLVADLGELWEQKYRLPLPLGGIAVKRSLPDNVKKEINKLVFDSVKYAFDNPSSSYGFIKKHCQIKDDSVINQHINLYVNDYSLDLGKTGKSAIEKLQSEASRNDYIKHEFKDLFVLP